MTDELNKYFKGDELAATVWLSKYATKGDKTPDDMHKRMAKEFAKIENEYLSEIGISAVQFNDLSKYGKNRDDLTENSIYSLFKDFKYIIPQGSIMSQLGSKVIGSLSNCFVVESPKDSYGGIFNSDQQLAQLMKRRGGVGIDISTLRPLGAKTSNVAQSSTGAVSFMHRFSNTTREVAQNGRRGALMISMDVRHPDIMDFIKIKRDLTQVTGANISIKLNDKFMQAVDNNDNYTLQFPVDSEEPTITKTIVAREYWDEIIKSAHGVAEPGLMFWDAMVDYSPDGVYPQYKQVTTNPCGEIAMQPYDACRLIAVNLFSFVDEPFTKKATFNFKKFYEVNYEALRIADDVVDLELKAIDRILNKIKNDPEDKFTKDTEKSLWKMIHERAKASRRTGLGITGLADMLAALGYSYDSDESLKFIDKVMHVKMESELDCTIDLGIIRGAFSGFIAGREYNTPFYNFIRKEFPNQYMLMLLNGRRNVSWSTIAPTGTVSILTQTTSGIEPLFQPFYTRRKKVNPDDKNVRVDFVDKMGDSWTEYSVLHTKFKDWMLEITPWFFNSPIEELSKDDLNKWFEKSPWYGSTANDISWKKRVEMQAILQTYITHSISSTINLPKTATEEEVSDIYMKSWKSGLKGVTVYRDGSRDGVLVTENNSEVQFKYNDAIKRPKSLNCDIHITKYRGREFVVIVGLYHDKPYEVFAVENDWGLKPSTGIIKKSHRGVYELKVDGDILIDNVTNNMEDEEEALTRMLSMVLRHGGDITFAVEQLRKSKGDITAFSKSIARVLNKYVIDRNQGEICPECSSELVREEGCIKCKACGYEKCG